MTKKDIKVEDPFAAPPVDPFVGGDPINDDLSGMDYPKDETDIIETMPPETKEERGLLEAALKTEEAEPEVKAEDKEAEPEVKAEEGEDGERIPHGRFQEVVDERNELRAKVAEMQKSPEAEAEADALAPDALDTELEELNAFDFDKAEDEYMDAVNEGEKDTARTIRKDIREKDKRIAELNAQKIVSSMTGQQTAETEFLSTAAELEGKYPILDNNSATFDADKQAETIELFQGYALSGNYSRPDALRKATEIMAKMNGWGGTDKTVETTTPKDTEKPADLASKVEANNKQPPRVTQTQNVEVSDPSIGEISEEEFAALPEDTKRRLRGDYFTPTP